MTLLSRPPPLASVLVGGYTSVSLPLPSVPFSLPLSPSLPLSRSRLSFSLSDARGRGGAPAKLPDQSQRWCISLRCAFDRPVARGFLPLLPPRSSPLLATLLPPNPPVPPSVRLALSYTTFVSPVYHSRSIPRSFLFVRRYHCSLPLLSPPPASFSLVHFPLASSSCRLSRFTLLVSPRSPVTPFSRPLRRACNLPYPTAHYPCFMRRFLPFSPSTQCLFVRPSLLSMTVEDMRRSFPKFNSSDNFSQF